MIHLIYTVSVVMPPFSFLILLLWIQFLHILVSLPWVGVCISCVFFKDPALDLFGFFLFVCLFCFVLLILCIVILVLNCLISVMALLIFCLHSSLVCLLLPLLELLCVLLNCWCENFEITYEVIYSYECCSYHCLHCVPFVWIRCPLIFREY